MSEIKWEKVTAGVRTRADRGTVYLKMDTKGRFNRICISADLAAKLPWVVGDSIWPYTSGNTLFKISPDKSDIRLRKNGNGYVIGNSDFAQTIHGKAQAVSFKAWVDGDSLIFTPKEEC